MHYYALALIPTNDKRDIKQAIEEIMAPYDENLELPVPMSRPCYCSKYQLDHKPEHDCEECQGTGTATNTRNPRGYWDWFEIGGRWNDAIPGNVESVAKVGDRLPYTLITPDGGWYSKKDLEDSSWLYAKWTDEERKAYIAQADAKTQAAWDIKAKRILEASKDCIAVVVDYHV